MGENLISFLTVLIFLNILACENNESNSGTNSDTVSMDGVVI